MSCGQIAVRSGNRSSPPPESQVDRGEDLAVAIGALTNQERLVLLWTETPPIDPPAVRVTVRVPCGRIVEFQRRGYGLLPATERMDTIGGILVVTTEMEGQERDVWSYQEISKRIGISAEAVRSTLRRVRAKLRQRMGLRPV
jgi:RNA polymerase sigma factor (sigma-70 family)